MFDPAPSPRETFDVLVFDMAHTGEPGAERRIEGFAGIAEARAYAEARVRASLEDLRTPGMSDAALRSLWHLYGEDCVVPGGHFSGRAELDLYIAVPATPAECDWAKLTPRLTRYRATVLISDASGEPGKRESVWAGGVVRRYARPSRDTLLRLFAADARAAFLKKGIADPLLTEIHVAHLFELPDPPEPRIGKPLRRWRVEVDFVCHDVKFGASASGVFIWHEQPEDAALSAMTHMLIADALSLRGDGPDYAAYSDILAVRVDETTDEPDEPLSPSETPLQE